MLKLTLVAAVVVCLSVGSGFAQQVDERGKQRGPRQAKLGEMPRSVGPSMMARSFNDRSDAGTVTPVSVEIPSSQSGMQPKSSPDMRQSKSSNQISSATRLSNRKSLYDLKMPGEYAGLGLPSLMNTPNSFRTASLVERNRIESLLMPGSFLRGLGGLPSIQEVPVEKLTNEETTYWKRLLIEVSHSSHIFKLFSEAADGRRETLYECKIGLGAPEFPTPVGVYYVTHIYDQDPWWIPPPNRAWAAGDSPSQRVYGGTMAPLLKKKMVSVRKKDREKSQEDFVENQVKLEDYGYRFHGTNQPRSIGRNQSHGCVRMLSDDAKRVSNLIKDHVGALDRRESENGPYVVLKSPVILNLVK